MTSVLPALRAAAPREDEAASLVSDSCPLPGLSGADLHTSLEVRLPDHLRSPSSLRPLTPNDFLHRASGSSLDASTKLEVQPPKDSCTRRPNSFLLCTRSESTLSISCDMMFPTLFSGENSGENSSVSSCSTPLSSQMGDFEDFDVVLAELGYTLQ